MTSKVMEDPSNSKCVDCRVASSVFFNITYATFHCADCAAIHMENFHKTTSHLKPIEEPWDPY